MKNLYEFNADDMAQSSTMVNSPMKMNNNEKIDNNNGFKENP